MSLPELLHGRLSLPVVASPLFIVSGPELVAAQCKAGIVGSFPALNARPAESLDDWLVRIKEEVTEYAIHNPLLPVAPFAVNQICHPSNDRLQVDTAVCVRHRVPIIVTSLQLPQWIVDATHSYGGLGVSHDNNNQHHPPAPSEGG